MTDDLSAMLADLSLQYPAMTVDELLAAPATILRPTTWSISAPA